MHRLRWLIALVLVVCAGSFALAQTQAVRHTQPERRAPYSPPPLPLATGTPSADATVNPSAIKRTILGSQLVPFHGKPLKMLSLEEARHRMLAVAGRRPKNASGGTITLLGDHNAYSVANNPYVTDYTLGYGSQVGFDCSNLTPSESNIQIVVFAPDGSQFGTPPTLSTDASGNCQSNVKDVTLATPYGSGTDAAYAGVWAVAVYRPSHAPSADYEAVTYFVVQSETPMVTYSDGALNHATRDFTKGQTIYVVASSLNSSDSYAMGWVYTAAPPLQCVYALPSTYLTNGPNCFSSSLGGLTGTIATSGQFEGAWVTSGTNATGTYSIQLYDVTKKRLVATQQISLQPASPPSVSIVGYASGSSTPVSQIIGDDAFANDGITDQSVASLGFNVTGLTANHTYKVTLSNPNGAVLQPGPLSTAAAQSHVGSIPTVTADASGNLAAVPIPLPSTAAKLTGLGPTLTSFVNTTMTAQFYDTTSSTVAMSKSFSLLAYAGSFAWQGSNSVNADPGNSCAGTHNYLTVTNTAATLYGSLGADGLTGIAVGPDAGGNLTVCGTPLVSSVTDSAGHTWNLSTATIGGQTYMTAQIQQVANTDALPVGGTVTIPVDLAAPSSHCRVTPACQLQTRVRPLHGLGWSGANTVSNGLLVGGYNNMVTPSTYAWAVSTPSPGGGIAAPPPFTQMMYVSGTNSTTSSNKYTLVATVNNNNPTGTGQGLQDVLFTFPPGWDFTVPSNKPTVAVYNGAIPLAGWSVYTASGTSNNVTASNSFAISCGTSNNTTPCFGQIGPTSSATVVLTVPMPPITFALYPITAVGNFDGGCIAQVTTKCTAYASTTLSATGTLNNTVAGTTNVDSTTLGVYSLDTTKMSGTFAPQQIGAGVPASTTFTFTNTSTSADPNPDYIDQINVTFPSGADPGLSGVNGSLPTGWTASGSGGTYTFTAAACSGVPCQKAYAVAPGGTLAIPITYANASAGTYSVTWTVRGANGNTTTTTSGTSTLKVTTTAASSQWHAVGGYPTASTVTSGQEPTVGSDSDKTYGNAYTYRITNTGQDTISAFSIVVPWKNRFATAGTDSGGVNWTFTGTPSITITPGTSGHTCTTLGTPVSPTSGADGHIDLSGCTIKTGDYVDVGFTLKAPYQIGSEFDFKANVCSAITTCTGGPPYTTGGQPASPQWSTAEYVKIVADGRLSIIYYSGTSPTVGSVPALPNPAPGLSTPSTVCTGCSITSTGTVPVIDLGGAFVGNVNFTDLFDVVVTSDVNSPNYWTLYVNADVNPNNSSANPEMAMTIHDTVMYLPQNHGFSGDAYTIPAAASGGTFFYVPTTSPGQQIGNYAGNAYRTPLDSIQSIRMNTTGDVTGHTITLTYTLIVN